MAVKQQLKVVHKTTVLGYNRIAVQKITGFNQQSGPARAQLVRALVNKLAVVRADYQVVVIV